MWDSKFPAYYYGEGAEDFCSGRSKEEALEKSQS